MSKRVLQVQFLARLKARSRGAGSIEIEDLLMGLLIEDQGQFLKDLSGFSGVGVDIAHLPPPHRPFLARDVAANLAARVEAICTRSEPKSSDAPIPLSDGAKRALASAAILRDALRQREIEPLHLLAALVGVESCESVRVFLDAGISAESVIRAIQEPD